jgi:hypoxanthine phosphoribosyltransferase
MVMPEKIFISEQELALDSVRLAKNMYDSGYTPDAILGIWRGGTWVATYVTGALKRLGIDRNDFSLTGKSYNPGVANQSHVIKIYNMGELAKHLRETGCRRLCLVDDVIDTAVTGDGLMRVALNGLRRKDATVAHLMKKGETTDMDPADAMKLDGSEYISYDFPVALDSVAYTMRVPMVADIDPVCEDVEIVAPYQKPYANRTKRMPKAVVRDFNMIDGRPVWLNFPYELEAEDITDAELRNFRGEIAKVLLTE